MNITATQTQFCHGIWSLESIVQMVVPGNDVIYVVTKETPFHPVSHIWPDHPADKGVAQFNGQEHSVIDCQVGAVEEQTSILYVGKDIPVKRDTEGWVFVVVHCLSANTKIEVGSQIQWEVDKEYQDSLSRGHSAGHFAFLALNKVLSEKYWRKDADRKDSLGSYDFNSYAQETSFVTPDLCTDTYRLGKTLKKRGLNVVDMITDLPIIEEQVNDLIKTWFNDIIDVKMRLEGLYLTDSRYWECLIKGVGSVSIPCGGSHIKSSADLSRIRVSLNMIDTQNIQMQTYVNEIHH
ncbi:alanyl-tRNA editing protein [Vibrio makurazakiensis]|uniref:alanyl-tRNA editing protein n=1 Tax=Vibrio makurazakiensis TaxID=2910250 RepID=UPI003D100E03